MQKKGSKGLRLLAIIVLAFSAVFTLLAGIGTTCVAFNPTGYGPSFSKIAPLQWLWVLFVIVGIVSGIAGIMSIVHIIRNKQGGYKFALTVLAVQTLLNLIHLIASRAIRGSSMPVDPILYTNVIALLVFLIPGVRDALRVGDTATTVEDAQVNKAAAAISLLVTGLLVLTIQYWMAPTHVIEGINYADVWHNNFLLAGGGMIILSAVLGASWLAGRTRVHAAAAERNA
ncbi:MAG TPA: hypothetical protein PKD55_16090 [Bellilinea sp.]|nr:hypothetical protein [Bellilinea sp.]